MLNFYIAVAQHGAEKASFGFSKFKGSCCTASCITRLTRQLSHVIKGDEIACFRVEWELSKLNQYLQIGMKQVKFPLWFYVFFFLTLIM